MEQLLPPSLLARLDALDLLSRKVLSGKLPGERRSKRRGRSVEFDDFRQYVPGDDLRHIDWNIVGRLDRLFVKLFREEEDLSLTLVVDASPSMNVGDPSKLVYAMQLSMALGYIGLVNQNRVSVAAFGAPIEDEESPGGIRVGLRRLSPMRGRLNARRLADFLLSTLNSAQRRSAVAGIDPTVAFDDAIRALARGDGSSPMTGTRGITLLISDFLLPETPGSLRFIAGSPTLDTYAVQVLSPGELDPAALSDDGLVGDLRLTDVETGRAQEVTVTPATVAQYRRNLGQSIAALKSRCATYGITHSLISTSTEVEQVVTGTLRRGGLLR